MGLPRIIARPSGSQSVSVAALITGEVDVEMVDLTAAKSDKAPPDMRSESGSSASRRRAVHRATALAMIQTLESRGASPPPLPLGEPGSSTFAASAFSGFKRLASVDSSTSSHGIKRTFIVRSLQTDWLYVWLLTLWQDSSTPGPSSRESTVPPAKKKAHTTTARPWWPPAPPPVSHPLPGPPRRATMVPFHVLVPPLPRSVARGDYKAFSEAFSAPPAAVKQPKPRPRKRAVPKDKQVASPSILSAPPPSLPPVQPATQSIPPAQPAPVELPSTPPPLPPVAEGVFDKSEPQLARASASEDFAPLEIGDIVLGETSPPLTTRVLCAALQHVAPERDAAWWRQRAQDEDEEMRRWRADIEREKAQMMGTWAVGLSVSSWAGGGQEKPLDVPDAPVKKAAAAKARAKPAKSKATPKSARPSASAQTKRKGKARAPAINATASSSTVVSPPSLSESERQQSVRAPSQQVIDASQPVYAPLPSNSASITYGPPEPQFAPLDLPSHHSLHVFQRQEHDLSQGPSYPYPVLSQGSFLDQQYMDATVALHIQVPNPQLDPRLSSLHSPIAEPSLPAAQPDFGIAFGAHGQGDGVLGMSFAAALGGEMIDMHFRGEQAEPGLPVDAVTMPMTTIDPALLGGAPPVIDPPPSDRPTSPSERHPSPLEAAVSTSGSSRSGSGSGSGSGRERTTEPSSERTLAATDEDGEKTGGKGGGKGKGKGKEKARRDAKGAGKGKGKIVGKKKARREMAGDGQLEVLEELEMTFCHHCRRTTTRPKMLCVETKPSGEPCGKRFCVNCIFKVSVAPVSGLYLMNVLTTVPSRRLCSGTRISSSTRLRPTSTVRIA